MRHGHVLRLRQVMAVVATLASPQGARPAVALRAECAIQTMDSAGGAAKTTACGCAAQAAGHHAADAAARPGRFLLLTRKHSEEYAPSPRRMCIVRYQMYSKNLPCARATRSPMPIQTAPANAPVAIEAPGAAWAQASPGACPRSPPARTSSPAACRIPAAAWRRH